ncbi:Rieske 2Fe-2S domain-containing protein [Synechococcales cyanobacterium C]|uniref:Rieske 2Fe-2S domain-containing protein n=1 Tax=Petrachloros mirabilis ULC683 TaxID=2781853 RepID=A0A8K2A7J6_9CYAN|nr:ubiquinol-cytochrome c reductase iron-sulfur subunit [Petrachloros mirabilis]NCJ06264.1 Rieske 2Fe-2S domain-containing protein [Petrachloros mirabilis ULC683]
MERRAFLSWVGVGFLASSLPVAIAACSAEPTDTADTPDTPGTDITNDVNVGTVADLDAQGFLLDESETGRPLIIVRDPVNPEQLIALNAACTHRNCTVNWEASETQFSCQCHGSQFSAEGEVTQGPADRPLPRLSARIEGDVVLVEA